MKNISSFNNFVAESKDTDTDTIVVQKPWKKEFYHRDDVLPKSDRITVRISYQYNPEEEEDIDKHLIWTRIESGVDFVVIRNAETKERALEIRDEILGYLNKDEYLDEDKFFRSINTKDALAYRDY